LDQLPSDNNSADLTLASLLSTQQKKKDPWLDQLPSDNNSANLKLASLLSTQQKKKDPWLASNASAERKNNREKNRRTPI
jgi:hypothetical protein